MWYVDYFGTSFYFYLEERIKQGEKQTNKSIHSVHTCNHIAKRKINQLFRFCTGQHRYTNLCSDRFFSYGACALFFCLFFFSFGICTLYSLHGERLTLFFFKFSANNTIAIYQYFSIIFLSADNN